MADILDDGDWDFDDDELIVDEDVTEEVTGGAPEFGQEDDEDDLDIDLDDDDLTEDEILRRAMLDDLEEGEGRED